ncbi:uncharacterized protein FYW47_000317 [Aplochiton taeniatus]
MIHNTLHSLCLEDSITTGLVQLKRCNLDSEHQQWIWRDQRVLVSVGTSRCLSAHHTGPVQTVSCDHLEDWGDSLLWDCERNSLISQNNSLELSTDGKHLSLSHKSKHSKWKSLDEGDICQDRLRSKRASSEPDEFEVKMAEEQRAGPAVMTEEQREFLRWYYRTEDPTPWKFAMLGLSFGGLLLGCLLLGMGVMANKNRKKIANYKTAALANKSEGEELKVIIEDREHSELKATYSDPMHISPPSKSLVEEFEHCQDNGGEELKPGDIVVTWKDGNISTLYSEPVEKQDAVEKEESGVEAEVKEEEEGQ